MKLPKNLQVVLVEWEDATRQEDESEPLGTMLAYTVGFLVRKTKKDIVVCGEIFENGGRRELTSISKKMVRTIQPLAEIPVRFSKALLVPPIASVPQKPRDAPSDSL